MLRPPPHNTGHATFMQPFQCDLQAQLQETHRTTQTGTTIVAKHIQGTKRPQPHPRTHEVPFIAGCSHLTRKNTRLRAPASSPQHTACNIHAGQFFCDVLLCSANLTPPFIKVNSFVMYCYVKSHTTLHQSQFFSDVLLSYVMQSLTPPFIKVNSFLMYCYVV